MQHWDGTPIGQTNAERHEGTGVQDFSNILDGHGFLVWVGADGLASGGKSVPP